MPWRGDQPLLLASGSRTRRSLLESAGIPVEAVASEVDERAHEAGLDSAGREPGALARSLAWMKTWSVAQRLPDRVVVGADQVLDLDGEAVPKPEDAEGARRLLGRLAGRTHRLRSAFCVARAGSIVANGIDDATLTMRPLGDGAIARYVSLAGPAVLRSAGGYEIEGLGIHLFADVAGDYTTILGLPVRPLLAALRGLDLLEI